MKPTLFLLSALLLASASLAREPVPVYGPARTAMDDDDLLAETILEPGVLAISPAQPWKVFVGDGITPGGIPIHPEGCVTNFNGVSVATTNLDMRSWSIKWGPWQAHGDANEWDLGYGTDETWLRLIRDSGQAYLAYDFTIVDAMHYRFELAWTGDGYDFPVLQVSTNLLEGFATVDPADVTYSRPDSSHLVIDYAVPDDYVFLSFWIFAANRLSTGAYFDVPIHADYGLQAVGSLTVTGRVESYYDEHAEETRDRYVPGSITLNGVTRTNLLTDAEILAMVDDFLVQRGIILDGPLYGLAHLSGYAEYLSFEEGLWLHQGNFDFPMTATNSTWNFQTPTAPKWNGVGLATTSHVATAISSLSNTVSDWIADVADDRDRADNALSNNITSVERRVGALERTDTCILWWKSDTMESDNTYNWIPTNFPTRNLTIIMSVTSGVHTVSIPTNFVPDTPKALRLVSHVRAGSTNYFRYGEVAIQTSPATGATIGREYFLIWDAVLKVWQLVSSGTINASIDAFWPGGRGIPINAPSTVEEWLALHPEWATP